MQPLNLHAQGSLMSCPPELLLPDLIDPEVIDPEFINPSVLNVRGRRWGDLARPVAHPQQPMAARPLYVRIR
jgi:hypothetical protein